MTITSPEGVCFAKEVGAQQVVLARELSLRELAKFESDLPLEVFVHGALCVAYSGQCRTSESLGQRSANRGECAQACRMPYEIVVDGAVRDLGDKRYLLSLQDLVAIPELTRLGIRSFKIEGRLKTAEYVAAVTSVYRKAALEDVFSRLNDTPYRLDRTMDSPAAPAGASLSVLCRTMAQIEAAAGCGVKVLCADFEDIRRYKDAVGLIRNIGNAEIFLATPRIQKVGEDGFFKVIEAAGPDGVLIRNVGAISYFRRSSLRKLGDFSLNVSNPAAAAVFLSRGLERVTISYDLNIEQVLALLAAAPPEWFELSIHQHMPMFHMEHCVFAAFLSRGTSFLDCGRPCEKHRVHLRDRVGVEHPLRADVGCRNTLFNASAQTGAAYFSELRNAGLAHFRVELLEEEAAAAEAMLRAYQALLSEATNGARLWRSLKVQTQLGVTRGKLIDAPR